MERRFVTSTLDERDRLDVYQGVAQLRQGAKMIESDGSDTLPDEVTHVVVRGAPRSMKALCALVSARYIVSPQYIANSVSAGFWLDEMEESAIRIHPPPLEGQRFVLTMEPGAFRDLIERVIVFGGGHLASRQHRQGDGSVMIANPQQLLDYCMTRQAVAE
jgi:hypothetical protein